ncbi:hypothetical protein CRG98_022031 [Punica granatum]|uniref:Uncharacterized protein n=1 Tax=Punica granatum TaxID=22663 RepID=A0A2I0JNT7_PUNGR|nr:hypothetical protein CRG98_022031 [Punica granatum]
MTLLSKVKSIWYTIFQIIDHVLLSHAGPVRKFEICHQFIKGEDEGGDVDRRILHLLRRSVEELMLSFPGSRPYKILLVSLEDIKHLNINNPSLQHVHISIPLGAINFQSPDSLMSVAVYFEDNITDRNSGGNVSSSSLNRFLLDLPHVQSLKLGSLLLKSQTLASRSPVDDVLKKVNALKPKLGVPLAQVAIALECHRCDKGVPDKLVGEGEGIASSREAVNTIRRQRCCCCQWSLPLAAIGLVGEGKGATTGGEEETATGTPHRKRRGGGGLLQPPGQRLYHRSKSGDVGEDGCQQRPVPMRKTHYYMSDLSLPRSDSKWRTIAG